MVDFIKKYEIWIFLVLAPVINTIITYANSKGIITGFVYTHGRFYALLFLLICIVKFTKGNEGLKDVFRPMLKWKINPKWYIFSLLFSLTIAAFTLFLKASYNGDDYFSLLKFNIPNFRTSFFLLTWAFMGEVVWVSYSIRTLSKTMNPFYASQVIGFFWALWWVPSVYINTGVILDLPLWPLFLNMMGAAGMCTVIYGKTKSGICVWILQYMLNMSIIILPISPTLGGIPTYAAFATLYFLVMLGFMYFMNPAKKINIVEKV
ncbi:hypothetical protein [Aquimarina sp. 2201CG5-10]|uniref:hypothetical protein n=1 Tax=Aquimarina callyspongiae TaxID=3098150 RepID=UPI002AB519EC|nr:hypothetical protein [Aquimarina sp. 2201CG5-10]MDY8134321.1 hypothetical protein [Aquimarina sp. 2201CG5-10]